MYYELCPRPYISFILEWSVNSKQTETCSFEKTLDTFVGPQSFCCVIMMEIYVWQVSVMLMGQLRMSISQPQAMIPN